MRIDRSKEIFKNNSTLIFKMFYLFSAFSFAMAGLSTLPFKNEQQMNIVFKRLIIFSSICLVIVQLIECNLSKILKYKLPLFICILCGNILMIYSTYLYEEFNKGDFYILGSFLISLAYEIKIILLITNNKQNILELFEQYRQKFIRFASIAAAYIFILTSSVVLLLREITSQNDRFIGGFLNIIGGLIYIISVIFVLRSNQHYGYTKFRSEMQIPRIV